MLLNTMYESVQSGLGFRFLTEVEFAKKRIIRFPLLYEEIGKYSRKCLVQKFPYGLIYQYIEGNYSASLGLKA